ncbi:MAG: FAD-dependent oxidoreductase [Gammaproteobacteria bacterium]
MKLTTKLRTAVQSTVNRRHVLSLLGAATAALGLPRKLPAAPLNQWDLIVVGGGNAGLPAALFAAQRGARVLIIEAAGILGGTLHLSTGQMSAAGTQLQKSKGIEDSPQSHYDDVMRISKNTANPDLVHLAVFNAADTFDWLMDEELDVYPHHPVTGTTHEPYSHARYAWGRQGGLSILKILEAQLEPEIDSGRVTLALSTEVTELIQDNDGAVTGIVSRNLDGEVSRHSGHNILLTCGGYASNPEMFEELEGAKDYADVSYEYSQGAGITLGLAAGGYVRGGEHHLPLFGGIMMDDNYPSRMIASARHFPPNRPPWEIFVDRNGKRFLREDIPSHDAYEHALLAQPEERCWVVFDEAIRKQAPKLVGGGFGGPFDLVEAFEAGWPSFFHSETLAGLAQAAGLDPEGLENTVASYNEGQKSGKDALGRKHMPLPIGKAPYYAIQLQSWLLTSYAGLAVDKELRVIRADNTPIKGLYAAGELLGTGQTMGRSYCGGMMVTPALTFGRLLGQSMLKFPA